MNSDKLTRAIMTDVVISLVANGDINLDGKNEAAAYKEIRASIKGLIGHSAVIYDYREAVLNQARLLKKTDHPEWACVFYAVWIEHQLNLIVVTLCKRKSFNNREIDLLIRESNYRAKCSWLLKLLGVKELAASHQHSINKLMELRNSYIHYKWKPENIQMKKELSTILANIEGTVKYIKTYENRYILYNQKMKIKKLMKNIDKLKTA